MTFPSFAVGTVVRVRRIDGTFVVAGPEVGGIPSGTRWRCIARANGGVASRQVGYGDLTVVREAPTWQAGAELRHADYGRVVVIEDRGDLVRCALPDRRIPLKGAPQFFINMGPGRADLDKANLVLTNL
ncbi:hypothetical protein [Mesorhizobium sp. WSM3626]|uniref:hypothetical protein n=1 Tax=Mesorhizobium sp. WSM3626 TaxID=1040987 RepID=UPI000480C8E0|nr:hypothetical protein [Mesorhizobium sp. WSM3626]